MFIVAEENLGLAASSLKSCFSFSVTGSSSSSICPNSPSSIVCKSASSSSVDVEEGAGGVGGGVGGLGGLGAGEGGVSSSGAGGVSSSSSATGGFSTGISTSGFLTSTGFGFSVVGFSISCFKGNLIFKLNKNDKLFLTTSESFSYKT